MNYLSRAIAVLAVVGGQAHAQSDTFDPDLGLQACTPETATDTVRVGIRTDTPPFSSSVAVPPFSRDPHGAVTGYTVELCEAFLDHAGLEGCYEEVSAQDRFDWLAGQRIDMLCGATTATLNVREAFETTLYTFITASTILVPALDAERLGKTEPAIGYRAGTTSTPEVTFEEYGQRDVVTGNAQGIPAESRISRILRKHFPKIVSPRWVPVDSHFDVVDKLRSGELDAFIADQAILSALLRQDPERSADFKLEPEVLRLQPYAVVMAPHGARRDGAPADLALRFNEFLVTEKFRKGDPFRRFQTRLLEIFGRDVDVNFLQLAAIQGEIPVGKPVGVGPPEATQ